MAALAAPHRPAAEATSRRILVDAIRWKGGPQRSVDLAVLQDPVLADRRLRLRLRLRYRYSGERETRTHTVDPYGLVAKAGVWYLVADRRGLPRLFRAERVHSAAVLDDPVGRRPGVELADVREVLRRQVEDRPGGIDVTVRIRRGRLDLLSRLMAPYLSELPEDDGESAWVTARLSLGVVGEARQLLQFSDRLEVLSPPEVREEVARAAASVTDLYQRADGPSARNPSSEGLF